MNMTTAGGVSKVRGGQHTLVERLGYKVQGNASRLGTWTDADKAELLALVAELQPCGATDWEVIADKLGRWSKVRSGQAPTLTDRCQRLGVRGHIKDDWEVLQQGYHPLRGSCR